MLLVVVLLPVNVRVNTIIKDTTNMMTIELALVERHRERERETQRSLIVALQGMTNDLPAELLKLLPRASP